MYKTQGNAQDRLPVGQRVRAPSSITTPVSYRGTDALGPHSCDIGTVTEHLSGGGIAVLFDNYPAAWDYNASEAHHFQRGN